ncbi:MAG TPA: DUF2510 domain-containing protein [Trebonia sp.]|jgi:hypothetical protein
MFSLLIRGRRGKSLLIIGIVLLAIGIAIPIATAGSGGFILFSPIIVGIIAIVRGITQLARGDVGSGGRGGMIGQPPGYGQPPGAGGYQAPGSGVPNYGVPNYGGQAYTGAGYTGQGYASPGNTSQPTAATVNADPPGGETRVDYAQAGYAVPHFGDQGQVGQPQGSQPQGTGAAPGQPGGPPQANWYPDPRDPSLLRWWDGQAWTANTQPRR